MPKRSSADLETPRPDSEEVPRLLLPGNDLPAPARPIFAEIVASVGDGHFAPADKSLLEQLSVAIHVAHELAIVVERDGVMTVDGKVSQPVKVLKQQQALIGQLCSRLRLTPQNRISKDKAATTASRGAASLAEIYELAK